MNTRMKRRLMAATGVIVIALIVVLAVVGGNSAAKTVSVAEAIEFQPDKKIQVTGNVAANSFTIEGNVLTFKIYDAEADPGALKQFTVRYDGGVSATFGNDVTAICTGKKNADGVLNCTELVTKCPSKYENATNALTILDLLGYGDSVIDKPVKVTGIVALGTLGGVDKAQRFVLKEVEPVDSNDETALPVKFDGALPDGLHEGDVVVITGSVGADRTFVATDVALGA